MFIELLSACTIVPFGESLAFNSNEPIKCVSLNNQPCQARPTFIPLLLVSISMVEVVTLLMIHVLEFLFQIK